MYNISIIQNCIHYTNDIFLTYFCDDWKNIEMNESKNERMRFNI